MVMDVLANAPRYRSLAPRIAQAFDFVSRTDFAALATGKHSIDGDAMFMLLQRYVTKPIAEGRWEAHRRYIDLQYMIDGTERIGVGNIGNFSQEPYDEASDLLWLSGNGDLITLSAGSFTLFWPQDVHMPGLMADRPGDALKVVVKIAL